MTSFMPELSHPVRLDRIGTAPMAVTLEPSQEVRARLAKRFDLEALHDFTAELTIRRRRETGWIEVSGRLAASVVQTCVVTTDPVSGSVETDILELFDDSGTVEPGAVDVDPLADAPEPIAGDTLDVGEVAVQAFGLALDPYPRRPDAAALEVGDASGTGDSPFARLAALKGRSVRKG